MLESFIILQVAARPACSGNFLMNKLPSSPNRSFTELQQQKNLRFSHQGYLELSKGRSKKTAIMALYAHDRAQVSTNQLHPTQALVGLLKNFLTQCFHHTKSSKWNLYTDDGYNKTISDGGITVHFSIIKVHTSNWSSNNWGSSNSWGSSNTWGLSNSSCWDHQKVGDHRIPLYL